MRCTYRDPRVPKSAYWEADQVCSVCKTKVGMLFGGACAECFGKLHQKALKGDQDGQTHQVPDRT